MNKFFLLLILFQVKHFIADYPLQNKYMLGKFKADWEFFTPLLFHSWVHAVLTLGITLSFTGDTVLAVKMYFLDMVIHFLMDRIKAGPKYLGRFKDMYDRKFWWSLGLDQMVHHLTHYLIIYFIIKG